MAWWWSATVLLALALVPWAALAKDDIPDLCTDRPQSPCDSLCDTASTSVLKYNKFDNFPVCIEIASSKVQEDNKPVTSQGRTVQYPKLDEFSELNLNWDVANGASKYGFNPFNFSTTGEVGFVRVYTTGVQNDKKTRNMLRSPDSTYYFDHTESGKRHVLLFYTILVHMDMGKPTKLTWEMGDCSGCSSKECVLDTACGGEVSDCSDGCSPKVYIAFTGTDGRGQVLTSSGSMLSRFSAHGLSRTYSDLRHRL